MPWSFSSASRCESECACAWRWAIDGREVDGLGATGVSRVRTEWSSDASRTGEADDAVSQARDGSPHRQGLEMTRAPDSLLTSQTFILNRIALRSTSADTPPSSSMNGFTILRRGRGGGRRRQLGRPSLPATSFSGQDRRMRLLWSLTVWTLEQKCLPLLILLLSGWVVRRASACWLAARSPCRLGPGSDAT